MAVRGMLMVLSSKQVIDNVPQVLTDSELGTIGTIASFVPYLDTGDDIATALTGCGYACQAGSEERVNGFWRGVAAIGIVAPFGSSLVRHGVDEVAGVVSHFSDDAITLYRSVSPDELADVLDTGTFRPRINGHSMDAKWFSETYEGAVEWGNRMYEEFHVLSVTVSTSVADQMYRVTNLDGIANARAAIDDVLDKFNQSIRQINVEE